jgi:hypothetical protein
MQQPPAQVTSLLLAARPLSLADESRQALARRADLEAQDATLRKELQELATRRDELEKRGRGGARPRSPAGWPRRSTAQGFGSREEGPLTELAALGQAISRLARWSPGARQRLRSSWSS